MGGTYYISVVAPTLYGLEGGNIAAVVTANSGSHCTATLYIQNIYTAEQIFYSVVNSIANQYATLTIAPSNSAGLTSLPAGDQRFCLVGTQVGETGNIGIGSSPVYTLDLGKSSTYGVINPASIRIGNANWYDVLNGSDIYYRFATNSDSAAGARFDLITGYRSGYSSGSEFTALSICKGNITIPTLGGSGTQMVVTDNNGVLGSLSVVSTNYIPISNGTAYVNSAIYSDTDGLELPGYMEKLGANPSNLIENYMKNDTAGHYLRNTLYGTTWVGNDVFGNAGADTVNFVASGVSSFSIGTLTNIPLKLGTNSGIKVIVNGDGSVDFSSLASGGIVKAASSTGKLSCAINNTDYADPGSLVDFSAGDNPVGFASILNNLISYRIVGGVCHVWYYINGTSNSTDFTFTLPATLASIGFNTFFYINVTENGNTTQTTPGSCVVSGSTATLYTNNYYGAWITTLIKGAAGYLCYPV
jgi:hypothetical protein